MRLAWGLLWSAACGLSRPNIDTAAPKVVSISPTDGALAVPLQPTITVCFDKPMSAASLSSATVALSRELGRSASTLPGIATLGSGALCVQLSPQQILAPSSGYRVDLTKDLLSAAGVELDHSGSQKNAFSSQFRTAAPAGTASLWVPSDGTTRAPTDLAQIWVAFTQPMSAAEPAFDLGPLGSGTLSTDGLSAIASLQRPLSAGQFIRIQLAGDLLDAEGRPPVVSGDLEFTVGDCAEGGPPGLGAGTPIGRDRDGLLLYATDRPVVCGALLEDPACPSTRALPVLAQCGSAYDPCRGGSLCSCQVPLIDLCPGDRVTVTPQATGWNGRIAQATPSDLQLQSPLPLLILDELMLLPAGSRSAGRYLEIVNLDSQPRDLLGLQIADCRGSPGCFSPKSQQALGPFVPNGSTTLMPHGYALAVDAQFTPSLYPGLPSDTLLLAPQGGQPLLTLATNEPQPIGLLDASSGAVLSTFDGSLLPARGLSLERIDPTAPDPWPNGWVASNALGGTPGQCNSVSPENDCPELGTGDGGQP